MIHISNAILVFLIFLNLIGLTLAVETQWKLGYSLVRISSPIALCLVFFFIEHLIGLGHLRYLWPLTTGYAGWLLFRHHELVRRHWRVELAFTLGFLYAFAWRYLQPNIDSQSERMTNLLYISNYIDGSLLPPVDHWLPPFPFNFYYSFQHYGAALLGRWFGLDAGTAYNYGYSVLIGLIVAAAALAARRFAASRSTATWTILAFVVGGTGVSLLIHFMQTNPGLPASMRFIGDSALDKNMTNDFGHWVASWGYTEQNTVETPMETFSYLLSLGDYHAPLSGFLMACLALACIASVEQEKEIRLASALLPITVAVTMICNAWSFPFQAILVLAWAAYRLILRKPLAWDWFIIGGIAGFTLAYPHLREMALQSRDFNAQLKVLPDNEHTPLRQGLLFWWPALMILVLSILDRKQSSLSLFFTLFWIVLFAFTEIFYIDDVYSGKYDRFNTTLKWWPWIYGGVFLTVGSLNLTSPLRFIRYGTALTCCVISLYACDLLKGLRLTPRDSMGLMNGSDWLAKDPVQKAVIDYLRAAPPGAVLENITEGAYTPGSAFALLTGHPSVLGWSAHEQLWHAYRVDIKRRGEEGTQFYHGQLPNPSRWLLDNNVTYILWLKGDNFDKDNPFSRINDAIKDTYTWYEFYGADNFEVGVWIRRSAADVQAPIASAVH